MIRFGFPGNPEDLAEIGPTLPVQIGFDPQFRPEDPHTVILPERRYPALIDTGAHSSCIDSQLAEALGLPIIDRIRVGGVGGSTEVNAHLAQIYVPSLDHTIYGEFSGVHLALGGQPHQALLGRDFLRRFTFAYEGRNGTCVIVDESRR